MESGSDATQDLSFYSATTGTVASATDQAFTGPRSIKCSSGAGNAVANFTSPAAILADAGRRISFRFRFDSLTYSADNQLCNLRSSAGLSGMGTLRLKSTGVLNIDKGNGTVLAAGTKVLAINTWYHITFCFVLTSTTVYHFRCFIDGVQDSDVSNSTALTRTGSDNVLFGVSNVGANVNFWFDNIYVENDSSFAYPGDVRITAKRPNANGTTNNFVTQIGSGGSGYGSGHSPQVNEQPLSTTNGWSVVAVAATTEEYNVEDPATGDVNITGQDIVDYAGWVYTKALAAETGQIVLNNVTTNISITTSNAMFTAFAGSQAYPAGTGTDIGEITSATATTVSLFECGILVAYKVRLPGESHIWNQAVNRASTY